MKTTRDIAKMIDLDKCNEVNKKWYSEEEIRIALTEMKYDCNNCYTELTKNSDFENVFDTMNNIIFERLKKLLEGGDDK